MAADEDDAEYRRKLSSILREYGFDWVVDQAEAQISEGKPSAKQVSEQQSFRASDDDSFIIRPPRRRRASLITSEPYTESERLEILLGAIEAAVVQRSILEKAVIDELPAAIGSISFVPDIPSDVTTAGVALKAHEVDRVRASFATGMQVRAGEVLSALRRTRRADT